MRVTFLLLFVGVLVMVTSTSSVETKNPAVSKPLVKPRKLAPQSKSFADKLGAKFDTAKFSKKASVDTCLRRKIADGAKSIRKTVISKYSEKCPLKKSSKKGNKKEKKKGKDYECEKYLEKVATRSMETLLVNVLMDCL